MQKLDAKTWNKLMVLGEKQGSIKLKDLAQEMSLKEEDTLIFMRQVFPTGTGIEIYHQEGECWVDINATAIQYMLPLSPSEWIQLHQILESASVKSFEEPVFNSLKKKLIDNGPVNVVMELLNQLEVWDQELSLDEQKYVAILDEAAKNQKLVQISTKESKHYNVYPCKVIHLEGHLSMIAEDSMDHCLMVIPVVDIIDVHPVASSGLPKVSNFEIEEFISCIRAMNEKEDRLILKIFNHEAVNLFPEHHFLGKPCMITNPNGDLIWAAYVEPCEALFEWVASLGQHVEILDPTNFKEQYFMYCEEKLRKIA